MLVYPFGPGLGLAAAGGEGRRIHIARDELGELVAQVAVDNGVASLARFLVAFAELLAVGKQLN